MNNIHVLCKQNRSTQAHHRPKNVFFRHGNTSKVQQFLGKKNRDQATLLFVNTHWLHFLNSAWCTSAKQVELLDRQEPTVIKEFRHDDYDFCHYRPPQAQTKHHQQSTHVVATVTL